MNPQPCGACSARNKPCIVGCFFAQYFKVGEEEKFRVVLCGNLDESNVEDLRKMIVKTKVVSRQSYVDNKYINNLLKYRNKLFIAPLEIEGEQAAPEIPLSEVRWATRPRSHIIQQPSTFLPTQPPQSEPTQPSQSDVGRSGFELLNIAVKLVGFLDLFSEESKKAILSLIEEKGMRWLKMNVSNAVKDLVQKGQKDDASACATAAGDSAVKHDTLVFENDDVVIVATYLIPIFEAKRGYFKGLLEGLMAMIKKTNVNPSEVGDIMVGTLSALGSQIATAASYAGFPENVPIKIVDRQRSSGLQAIVDVAVAIRDGSYEIGIGAGLEFMTSSPLEGEGSVNPKIVDRKTSDKKPATISIDDGIQPKARFDGSTTAGNSSQVSDGARALLPMKRSNAAQKDSPSCSSKNKKGKGLASSDLIELQPVFKDGSTTAGIGYITRNSSQGSDGAAALLMERSIAVQKGLPILGVIKAFVAVPVGRGVSPATAISAAVQAARLKLDDIDLFVNNTASQLLDCIDKLGLDPKKVNVNGDATGCRGVVLLLNKMKSYGKDCRFGVISMYLGSGMEAAAVFERGDSVDGGS